MASCWRSIVFIIANLFNLIRADFTPHFRAFLHNNYGVAIAQMLERTDLGMDASFGGKHSDDEVLNNQAVVLVHGIGNKITRVQVRLYGSRISRHIDQKYEILSAYRR